MSKKLITLALTAVFIIAAFLVAAQLLSTAPENGGVPTPTPSPTPTPTPSLTSTPSPTATPTPSGEQQENEAYLHYRTSYEGGAETKAFLVDSQLYYGVYEENITRPGLSESWCTANAGDPCVVISGTIRNDYDKDYWFAITGDVYNSKGESIGPILTEHSPHPGFTVTYADSGAVESFEMRIKYDAKDIVRYDLFLAWQPTEIPPT